MNREQHSAPPPQPVRDRSVWRVWALAGVLAVGATALMPFSRDSAILDGAPTGSWLILACVFALAERFTVTVKYRSDSHTLSISELPMVFGLLLFPVSNFVIAQLVGLGVVLVVFRRQQPLRFTYNLAQTAASSVLAALILSSLTGPVPVAPQRLWGAIIIATLFGAFLNSALVVSAISIADRRVRVEHLPRLVGLASVNALTSATFGVLVIQTLMNSVVLAALASLPMIGTYLAYRGYVREQVARAGIEFLYETTKALHRSKELEAALSELLGRACGMFRSQRAAIWLRRADSTRWLVITADPDERIHVHEAPALIPADMYAQPLLRHTASAEGKRTLEQLSATNAMIASLRGTDGLLGVFAVADKRDGFADYDADDVHLFDLLANQIAISLENGQVERSLRQLTELEDELRHQATHDALTGLANRSLLQTRIAQRHEQLGSVLLIDLDDFKTINDSLGHGAGDEVLRNLAQRLGEACRADDLVARLGGDEFAVLLGGAPERGVALEIADRVSDKLREPMRVQGMELVLGASIGVAFITPQMRSLEDVLRNADVALYEAKRRGKGRSAVFELGMDADARTRLELVNSLRGALQDPARHEEIRLEYQPVVELVTGDIVGLEALVRWMHPTRGPLEPSGFLTVAEDSGLIIPLGEKVLAEAVEHLEQFSAAAGRHLFMTVNVAPRQLHHPGLVSLVRELLHRYRIEPSRLVLEMTETSIMRDEGVARERLSELKAAGVRVALDDFGTGYSSLSALHALPIDIVKIDRQFVTRLGPHTTELALVKVVLGLAETLRLEVIAEGIERPDQLEALNGLGCHYGQGYYFARPMPAERLLTSVLGRHNSPIVS